ncbi:Hypothetical protein, putative [Bodo saltans]|uniref:Uncharacterized protein n=1 Tax=Bodo saltans TaxID=75058 RepID=A0A0S4IP04_BODSA|nr:Hypothetical protein, putative [Bodo saltans]|eukprot:CUE96681.1 Hypothetical protein, putative [Bodo saltans]
MPRSTVAPLMRRSNIVSASPTSYNLQPRAEALSAKLERISVRAVTHTLPEEDEETAPSSSSPNRRNCWMTSSFDDISLIMRGDRNHPWSGVEELVVEDAALTIVSATSFKDREVRFSKPIRNLHGGPVRGDREVRFSKPIRNLHGGPVRGDILATLLSKGTLLDHSTPIFTITRDEVDDVQFFNGDIADGDIDKTFPKVAHVRICLKRYPPPMESGKREGACMRETISIVPMVLSTSPASFVNAKQRAEEMFGALLAWCCSDVELSLLSPLRASPK